MITVRDIRHRIRTVEKISKITRAMKTVAVIRLMKVQNQVLKQKPYALKIREIVSDLVAQTPSLTHPMLGQGNKTGQVDIQFGKGKQERRRIITALVLGSDRGLAGPFNNNLISETQKFIELNRENDVRLIVVGKKLRDSLRAKKHPLYLQLIGFYSQMTFDKVQKLAHGFLNEYMKGTIDELVAIYTEFRTTARQKVTTEQILPIGVTTISKKELFPSYIYEPDSFAVLDQVLPMYYDREVWRIFLESTASEHMARMIAMDMATINGINMIRHLTLIYNKARQESITRELSEISTAAEAFRVR
jgi:F-type H+-transporting ATPase subunit gamma